MRTLLLVSVFSLLFFIGNANAQVDLKSEIMWCESQDRADAINWNDAKITGSPSRGLYQFQPRTFWLAALRYKILPEGTTLKEAMKYIFRPEYNAAAAHGLIDDGEIWHWKNCVSKILVLR